MKITIKRPKSKIYDESKYRIYINGQKVATLQENQLQEIEVNDSLITIEARFNWFGSKKLNLKVNDGDVIEFLTNTLFSKASIILVAPIAILWVTTKNFETLWLKWIFGILLAVDVLLILYVLIIARRKWVSINHIKQ
ncbi:MAG: hypothetical protein PHD06_05305 [Bacteroidales bacterium]|jgi:hypothetical protein|nr:hypothetical protein [Bacteroidales bacterium]MDD4384578.1 hypothetical protein [Bacteroidales bacterium]MDY0196497.1 hypothetical protein [Tenuifilaceae bacterium]